MKFAFGITLISIGLTLFVQAPSLSHEGALDRYGCHEHKEDSSYHCHDGMLKGGNFDSRGEMVQRLRRQLEILGRPWPYGDLIEEDITSPSPRLEEQPPVRPHD